MKKKSNVLNACNANNTSLMTYFLLVNKFNRDSLKNLDSLFLVKHIKWFDYRSRTFVINNICKYFYKRLLSLETCFNSNKFLRLNSLIFLVWTFNKTSHNDQYVDDIMSHKNTKLVIIKTTIIFLGPINFIFVLVMSR